MTCKRVTDKFSGRGHESVRSFFLEFLTCVRDTRITCIMNFDDLHQEPSLSKKYPVGRNTVGVVPKEPVKLTWALAFVQLAEVTILEIRLSVGSSPKIGSGRLDGLSRITWRDA